MKKYLGAIIGLLFVMFVAAPVMTTLTPQNAAAASNGQCETSFLGIPPWYRGLTNGADCTVAAPEGSDALSGFIWRIVLNIIQMVLVIIVYVAIFFIIYGGFLFLTGGNNPSQIEKGRRSILSAVVGLVIALSAVAITNFIFEVIGSNSNVTNGIPQASGEQIVQSALNMVYFIAGAVAVLMIIAGGLMYVISSGDSGKVAKAKNMLTYAIVGLIIVLVAFAITNFVIGRFS